MIGPKATVQDAWGENPPEWVMLLADACASSSQNAVARAIGRSAALVSNVLRNKYPGDLGAVEEIVMGVYGRATVACPARGQIPSNECRDWQVLSRHYDNANSDQVVMYRACRSCSRMKRGDDAA